MFFEDKIKERLALLKSSHRHRELRSSSGISFVNNDYLGLASHPEMIEAGERALRDFGTGSRGSRLLGGHSKIYETCEEKLAQFFGAPAALFFPSGYQANLGLVRTVGELADHIVSDERNHASLIDAIALTKKPKTILPHQRWEEVPAELKGKALLLVSETLFSMDGDVMRGESLKALAEETDSFLILDEAHAAGVFREKGRGVREGQGDWRRLAVIVTFGKAFGVAGAAVLCSTQVRDWLVNTARTFVYTTASPPLIPAMVAKATEILERESWRRVELWERAERVREILRGANDGTASPLPESSGLWDSRSPIIPFMVSGEDRALRFCENMRKSGVELRAIRYPTVPAGGERVRISLNLTVTREETEFMAREMVKQWKVFS